MTLEKIAAGLVFLSSGLVACAYDAGDFAAGDPVVEDVVAQREQNIIGVQAEPNNSSAVAIYHRNTGECVPYTGQQFWPHNDTNPNIYSFIEMWWPRPCSGRVIKKDGTTNYILTARHCVTRNGEVDDPNLVTAGGLVSTSRLAPGVLAVTERANRVDTIGTPVGVTSTVHYQNYASYGDLAMVKAVGNLEPTSPPGRRGIISYTDDAYATIADYTNTLRTESYGGSAAGTCYGFANSGAGVHRHASGWDITAGFSNGFQHTLTSPNGATITGGDSGGSLWFLNIAQNWTTIRDVGVHSGSQIVAGGPVLLDFIQEALGYVYLVNVTNASGTVIVGTTGGDTSPVRQNFSAGSAQTRFKFIRSSGQLQLNGLCVRDQGLGVNVQVRPCNLTNVGWNMSVPGQIKNRSTGRCLVLGTDASATLRTETCTPSSTTWTFTADNSLL